jgi:uncharacterized protein (TIGR00730 family)
MNKTICVFCGSGYGNKNIYSDITKKFANEIVKNKFDLVYGGGNVGLMGILADTVIEEGGKVTGVIPEFLYNLNLGNKKISELKIVQDMHSRKKTMYELSDYFVALPGGIGTLEEILEIFTWQQLSLHAKPCALLNIEGYFDELLGFLNKSTQNNFMKRAHLDNLIIESDFNNIISKLVSCSINQNISKI